MIDITQSEPDFYKEFSCIGDKCRNNCCQHQWAIAIDKKTYKQYKNLKNPKNMAERFRSGTIKRNDNPQNDGDYAFLTQVPDSEKPWKVKCVFQQDSGLCEIQANLGHDFLCKTCRVYPRMSVVISDKKTVERGLSLSCEAVVKMFLDKKDPIIFESSVVHCNKNQSAEIFNNSNSVIELKSQGLGEYYFYLKAIGIAILQNRDYSVENRLIHLACFLKNIDKETQSPEFNIESFCEGFVAAIENKQYDGLLETKPQYALQMETDFELLDEMTIENILNKDIMDVINGNILKITQAKLEDGTQEKVYIEYIKNYNEFMKDKENLMENILVNEFHNMAMPISCKTAMEGGVALFGYFQMIRFLIATYLGERKEISEQELIDLIAYFGKTILHKTKRNAIVDSFFNKNNMDDLAHTILLIKS
ncbi:MAG: flagellin lysine-N-methylase [Oscillospiraceae bacterium]